MEIPAEACPPAPQDSSCPYAVVVAAVVALLVVVPPHLDCVMAAVVVVSELSDCTDVVAVVVVVVDTRWLETSVALVALETMEDSDHCSRCVLNWIDSTYSGQP